VSNISFADLLVPATEDEAKLARANADSEAGRPSYIKGLVESFMGSGQDEAKLNAKALADFLGKTDGDPLNLGNIKATINKMHRDRNYPVMASRVEDTLVLFRVATEGEIIPPGKRGRKPAGERAQATEQ